MSGKRRGKAERAVDRRAEVIRRLGEQFERLTSFRPTMEAKGVGSLNIGECITIRLEDAEKLATELMFASPI